MICFSGCLGEFGCLFMNTEITVPENPIQVDSNFIQRGSQFDQNPSNFLLADSNFIQQGLSLDQKFYSADSHFIQQGSQFDKKIFKFYSDLR